MKFQKQVRNYHDLVPSYLECIFYNTKQRLAEPCALDSKDLNSFIRKLKIVVNKGDAHTEPFWHSFDNLKPYIPSGMFVLSSDYDCAESDQDSETSFNDLPSYYSDQDFLSSGGSELSQASLVSENNVSVKTNDQIDLSLFQQFVECGNGDDLACFMDSFQSIGSATIGSLRTDIVTFDDVRAQLAGQFRQIMPTDKFFNESTGEAVESIPSALANASLLEFDCICEKEHDSSTNDGSLSSESAGNGTEDDLFPFTIYDSCSKEIEDILGTSEQQRSIFLTKCLNIGFDSKGYRPFSSSVHGHKAPSFQLPLEVPAEKSSGKKIDGEPAGNGQAYVAHSVSDIIATVTNTSLESVLSENSPDSQGTNDCGFAGSGLYPYIELGTELEPIIDHIHELQAPIIAEIGTSVILGISGDKNAGQFRDPLEMDAEGEQFSVLDGDKAAWVKKELEHGFMHKPTTTTTTTTTTTSSHQSTGQEGGTSIRPGQEKWEQWNTEWVDVIYNRYCPSTCSTATNRGSSVDDRDGEDGGDDGDNPCHRHRRPFTAALESICRRGQELGATMLRLTIDAAEIAQASHHLFRKHRLPTGNQKTRGEDPTVEEGGVLFPRDSGTGDILEDSTKDSVVDTNSRPNTRPEQKRGKIDLGKIFQYHRNHLTMADLPSLPTTKTTSTGRGGHMCFVPDLLRSKRRHFVYLETFGFHDVQADRGEVWNFHSRNTRTNGGDLDGYYCTVADYIPLPKCGKVIMDDIVESIRAGLESYMVDEVGSIDFDGGPDLLELALHQQLWHRQRYKSAANAVLGCSQAWVGLDQDRDRDRYARHDTVYENGRPVVSVKFEDFTLWNRVEFIAKPRSEATAAVVPSSLASSSSVGKVRDGAGQPLSRNRHQLEGRSQARACQQPAGAERVSGVGKRSAGFEEEKSSSRNASVDDVEHQTNRAPPRHTPSGLSVQREGWEDLLGSGCTQEVSSADDAMPDYVGASGSRSVGQKDLVAEFFALRRDRSHPSTSSGESSGLTNRYFVEADVHRKSAPRPAQNIIEPDIAPAVQKRSTPKCPTPAPAPTSSNNFLREAEMDLLSIEARSTVHPHPRSFHHHGAAMEGGGGSNNKEGVTEPFEIPVEFRPFPVLIDEDLVESDFFLDLCSIQENQEEDGGATAAGQGGGGGRPPTFAFSDRKLDVPIHFVLSDENAGSIVDFRNGPTEDDCRVFVSDLFTVAVPQFSTLLVVIWMGEGGGAPVPPQQNNAIKLIQMLHSATANAPSLIQIRMCYNVAQIKAVIEQAAAFYVRDRCRNIHEIGQWKRHLENIKNSDQTAVTCAKEHLLSMFPGVNPYLAPNILSTIDIGQLFRMDLDTLSFRLPHLTRPSLESLFHSMNRSFT